MRLNSEVLTDVKIARLRRVKRFGNNIYQAGDRFPVLEVLCVLQNSQYEKISLLPPPNKLLSEFSMRYGLADKLTSYHVGFQIPTPAWNRSRTEFELLFQKDQNEHLITLIEFIYCSVENTIVDDNTISRRSRHK